MSMNIYEFFSCFTELPVRIDDVRDQALEYDVVDEFQFIAVGIDPKILLGMHRMYVVDRPDGSKHRIAQIFWSSHISDVPLMRLVCCKEVLHIFDEESHTARSTEAVDKLIDLIVVPPSSGFTASELSDRRGMLRALMVLLPRDALEIIRPKYEAGEMSVEDVARLADIPGNYERLALSPTWRDIVAEIE